MLTLFSIPKPFAGHIGLIQRNALASWRRLAPSVEIILLGNETGVAEAAGEFGARHLPELALNPHGTPLISAAFAAVRDLSHQQLLMYSNADMLYDQSLLAALPPVQGLPAFLCSGQRRDIEVAIDLVSSDREAWAGLFASQAQQGRLHGVAGMDYFIFPRSLDLDMPDFAVGRVGWDSWLVWECRMRGLPVIDATADLIALHQNHDYSSLKLGYQHVRGPERDLNLRSAGGLAHLLTLREASHCLAGGQLAPPPWPRRCFALLGPTRPYQKLLALKRALT